MTTNIRKVVRLGSCVLLSYVFSGVAVFAASNDAYFTGQLGVALPNKFSYEHEDGRAKSPSKAYLYGVGLGYRVGHNFRIELDLSYMTRFKYAKFYTEDHSLEKAGDLPRALYEFNIRQKLSSGVAFANLFYDFSDSGGVIPYVTMGAGYASNRAGGHTQITSFSDGQEDDVDTEPGSIKHNFGWNVGAGISYGICDGLILDLVNYRYYDLGKVSSTEMPFSESLRGAPPLGPMQYVSKLRVNVISTGVRISF